MEKKETILRFPRPDHLIGLILLCTTVGFAEAKPPDRYYQSGLLILNLHEYDRGSDPAESQPANTFEFLTETWNAGDQVLCIVRAPNAAEPLEAYLIRGQRVETVWVSADAESYSFTGGRNIGAIEGIARTPSSLAYLAITDSQITDSVDHRDRPIEINRTTSGLTEFIEFQVIQGQSYIETLEYNDGSLVKAITTSSRPWTRNVREIDFHDHDSSAGNLPRKFHLVSYHAIMIQGAAAQVSQELFFDAIESRPMQSNESLDGIARVRLASMTPLKRGETDRRIREFTLNTDLAMLPSDVREDHWIASELAALKPTAASLPTNSIRSLRMYLIYGGGVLILIGGIFLIRRMTRITR
jgi:hypothetical protein